MQNLLANATANGSSSVLNVASISRGNYRTCKVSITVGTATVVLEGRGGPGDANWITLATFSGTGIQGVILTPQVRVTASAISGGAVVDVWLDAYDK